MPRNACKYRAVGLLVGALSLVGCVSSPAPGAQLAGSTWAVASAANAGGDDAAPEDMRMARDKLSLAEAAMATKQYDMARWFAEEAEVDAQLAGVKARIGGAPKATPDVPIANRVLREGATLNPVEPARSDVLAAQGSPQGTERADAELQRSLDALAKANHALARSGNAAEAEHWAYMARQHAAIAQEIARQDSTDKLTR
jgi:hypothetical protein